MLFAFVRMSIWLGENDWEARDGGSRGSETRAIRDPLAYTGLIRKFHIPWEFNLSQELTKDSVERWLSAERLRTFTKPPLLRRRRLSQSGGPRRVEGPCREENGSYI